MFIVIEGIDGAGCETQAKLITRKLAEHGNKVTFLKYPHYDDSVGKMIKDFLYKEKNLNAKQQFLLYSLQFILDSNKIINKIQNYPKNFSDRGKKPDKLKKQSIVVADRYFTSTLCYQTLEGIDLDKALCFASDFGIVKPNLVFYLDVDPEIAIKRKSGEQKEKNRREKDFQFIRKTYKQYDKLIKNQVWTKWIKINGERSVDEITEDIYNNLRVISEK